MNLVTAAMRRSTTTPNATMTTLASPTLGGAHASVWLVEMPGGATGPAHAFAGELVWAITRGTARLTTGDPERPVEAVDLRAGDTVVLPGGELRRFAAGPDGFSAMVAAAAPGEVTRAGGEPAGVPAWVA